MKKTIDDLTLQIMGQTVAEDLSKALPPRIKAKLAYWFRKQGKRVRILENPGKQLGEAIARKAEELAELADLKKNQIMARVQSDGVVKMDFGADVPEQVRKAAISWAKRKGLTPIEAELKKSGQSVSSIRFQGQQLAAGQTEVVAKMVWEISE